jgi:multimeric flavodoxin WrbA/protein-tyrosine-phosphatase
MLVLGFQGSPRIGGNTDTLLSAFLDEAAVAGAETIKIHARKQSLSPCIECRKCEELGHCAVRDDMQKIYPLLRRADLVVIASPIFFYGVTGFMKAIVDRSQALWAAKYVRNLKDPGDRVRRGFFLGLGATKGENLFEGSILTAKYFFDAVGAEFSGSLTYRRIEEKGDIESHPTALSDAREKARELITPLLARKKVLFICRENACRSQMAAAFARSLAGDRIEAQSAGSEPAEAINETMAVAMAEAEIDMAYHEPRSIDEATKYVKPDVIVTMGCEEACPLVPGARMLDWDITDPAGESIDFMRKVRDEIREKVANLIDEIT